MQNVIVPSIVEETRLMLNDKFKDIVFDEEPHKYYVNGVEYTPVSHVIDKFGQPFDLEKQSLNTALKKGMLQEDIKREWKFNNLCATVSGTRTHLFGEAYAWLKSGHEELIPELSLPQYVKEEKWLIPTYPKEFAVKKFFDELPEGMFIVGAEFRLSSQYMERDSHVCGTADLLCYYENPTNKANSGFILMDWKTNASLENQYVRDKGIMMNHPFQDYYDEALEHYYLQQNIYRRFLESVGVHIIGIRLIHLKDDKTFELVKVPILENNIIDNIL